MSQQRRVRWRVLTWCPTFPPFRHLSMNQPSSAHTIRIDRSSTTILFLIPQLSQTDLASPLFQVLPPPLYLYKAFDIAKQVDLVMQYDCSRLCTCNTIFSPQNQSSVRQNSRQCNAR